MQIRGGSHRVKVGKRHCDSLYPTDDGSLLLKNDGIPCLDYKLELLKDPSGKVYTRCKWAIMDAGRITCDFEA